MNLIEKIDQRFRSGNSVAVERATITSVEWSAFRELIEAEIAEAEERKKSNPAGIATAIKHRAAALSRIKGE